MLGTVVRELPIEWPDGKKKFRSLDEVVRRYDEVKLHESFDSDHAEMPAHASARKLRPKERKRYLERLKESRA
jgi:hypothetical protein